MLAFVFGRAHGPSDRTIQAPELTLGAGVHVAHPADDGVRLVIQVETVTDQFFELDLGRPFRAEAVTITATPVAPVSGPAGPPFARTSPLARRAVLAVLRLLLLRLCHVLILR
jgi:hypothetical protein